MHTNDNIYWAGNRITQILYFMFHVWNCCKNSKEAILNRSRHCSGVFQFTGALQIHLSFLSLQPINPITIFPLPPPPSLSVSHPPTVGHAANHLGNDCIRLKLHRVGNNLQICEWCNSPSSLLSDIVYSLAESLIHLRLTISSMLIKFHCFT